WLEHFKLVVHAVVHRWIRCPSNSAALFQIEAEVGRRRQLCVKSAERAAWIKELYKPLHSHVYSLQEFCRELIEELEHFEQSEAPKGRPNTMNNYGVPLSESECVEVEHHVAEGLLHRGQQMHGALRISSGQRWNLIMWMRASQERNKLCPMCGQRPRLVHAEGFADGFTDSSSTDDAQKASLETVGAAYTMTGKIMANTVDFRIQSTARQIICTKYGSKEDGDASEHKYQDPRQSLLPTHMHTQRVDVGDGDDSGCHIPWQPHEGAGCHQNAHPEEV
ncbi:2-oxoglutarate and iron-dependent oxygenase domain-containing protein 2-like, partial [Scleropages formosus]